MRSTTQRAELEVLLQLWPVQPWGTHHVHASQGLLTASSRRARAGV